MATTYISDYLFSGCRHSHDCHFRTTSPERLVAVCVELTSSIIFAFVRSATVAILIDVLNGDLLFRHYYY